MRRVAIVLHTHLPYVRRNGTWPCGEDFFHQAAAESYLPLIGALGRLANDGVRDAATIAITPVLAHQMADDHMRAELQLYLGREELRAMRQVANYRGWGEREIKDLAAFYARRGREHLQRLGEHSSIAAAFGALERAGVVELAGGPATHPLLPRIGSERLRRAQLTVGLDEHRRIFGRRPDTAWVPECAVAPGVEDSLRASGVRRVVVDPAATGGALHPVAIGASGVRAFPFDRTLTGQVWSPDGGYPAGEWYRDFHAWDLEAGFKNWRVTSREIGWLGKQPYEPVRAAQAARRDAAAFVGALEHALVSRDAGLLVAAFDTELFGHWWFEGPLWLEEVLRLLSSHPDIRPVTLAGADDGTAHPVASLRESTWGSGSDFTSWFAPETEDMHKRLADAEAEAERLLERAPDGPAAAQLVRELFLLQSSDWPYLVIAGRNPEYARARFESHLSRFGAIADALRDGDDATARTAAAAAFDADNLLPLLRGLAARTASWEDVAHSRP